MKKCFLFFVFFNAVSIPNIYASCYDISSCSKELSDIEISKSSNATCYRVTKDGLIGKIVGIDDEKMI